MEATLFIFSITATVLFFTKSAAMVFGHSLSIPMPIGHLFDVSFSNTYISTPSIMYQVYFWSNYAGIFN